VARWVREVRIWALGRFREAKLGPLLVERVRFSNATGPSVLDRRRHALKWGGPGRSRVASGVLPYGDGSATGCRRRKECADRAGRGEGRYGASEGEADGGQWRVAHAGERCAGGQGPGGAMRPQAGGRGRGRDRTRLGEPPLRARPAHNEWVGAQRPQKDRPRGIQSFAVQVSRESARAPLVSMVGRPVRSAR